MVERAIPKDNGKVERIVWAGDGQPPVITEFDTDEMLIQARAQERRAEYWQKIKSPFSLIREKVLGALDTSIETRAEQLAAETRNNDEAFLHSTVDGWRDSKKANHA